MGKKVKRTHVTPEEAEQLHADTFRVMQKIVKAANTTADNPDEGAECIDKDQLRLAVNFLRDNGIKPMSEYEREQIRLKEKELDDGFDSDKERREHLEQVRKAQQGKISLHMSKDDQRPIVTETVRDNRLGDLYQKMEEEKWGGVKRAAKEVKRAAKMKGLSVDEYLQTLPVDVRADAIDAIEKWKEHKHG